MHRKARQLRTEKIKYVDINGYRAFPDGRGYVSIFVTIVYFYAEMVK